MAFSAIPTGDVFKRATRHVSSFELLSLFPVLVSNVVIPAKKPSFRLLTEGSETRVVLERVGMEADSDEASTASRSGGGAAAGGGGGQWSLVSYRL